MSTFSFEWLRLICICGVITWSASTSFGSSQHAAVTYVNLPAHKLHQITQSSHQNDLREIFRNINIIRQVGTSNHTEVARYISSYLTKLGWTVEWDNFTTSTVIGPMTFRNIIATSHPLRSNFLVLACHYDSKQQDGFVGSIDSAMPCSIILKVADSLAPMIYQQKHNDLGLRLVFFDGEESFLKWTTQDSLYGSRHLASLWSERGSDGRSELSKIRLFVLLDLLGYSGMTIPRYKSNDLEGYVKFSDIENQLASLGLLQSKRGDSRFFAYYSRSNVLDDQIPFLERKVPVVHLIPNEFPSFWHTPSDNADRIDWKVSIDLVNIVEAFVCAALHL